MKMEQARKLTEDTLKALGDDLAAGRSESLTRYLTVMAQFHRYSFGNLLLILGQRPGATHVAGFHAWLRLGRHVRRGEKGIAILAPMLVKLKESASDDTAEVQRVMRFKVVYVFDVEQTDGEALPEFSRPTGDPRDYLPRLLDIATSRGLTVERGVTDLHGAEGLTDGSTIRLRGGTSPADEFTTLAHEIAHTILHFGDERPKSRTVRELEAEAVAFVVAQAAGLEAREAARDYIQLYNGDAAALSASLDRIQRTAAEILAVLLPDNPADGGE
jgi:antirestriction protein ArdC